MILNERFTGRDILFQGNRTLLLQSIPVGAKITQVTATIIPVNQFGNLGPSEDSIDFSSSNIGEHGETLTRINATPGWVEVDFHRRVTLINLSGNELDNSTLQVDIGGGTFIELNDKGAFKGPSDTPFTLPNAGFNSLPGVTVNRMRLTPAAAAAIPTISAIRVRNTAANVSLGIGETAPFFLHTGDLVTAQTTKNFTGMLMASLLTAEQKNGFYQIPVTLHSDRLTRLDLELNIEFVNQLNALPDQLGNVQLPYSYNATAESNNNSLSVFIPTGAKIVSDATGVKVEGSFDNSKIVLGEFDELDSSLPSVVVNTGTTQAQAFNIMTPAPKEVAPDLSLEVAPEVAFEIALDSIDLLLTSVSSQTKLQLDLRGDLDGKPDSRSLLSEAIAFSIDADNAASLTWTNIALKNPITLTSQDQTTEQSNRFWLLVQSLEGEAQWGVKESPSTENTITGLQQSKDGGMSWRQTTVSELSTQPETQFRLRQTSDTFHIPLEVKVGSGPQAKRLSLSKYEPLGRINFDLDPQSLADTINRFIDDTQAEACPQGEQLANSDFDLELDLPTFTLASWELIGGSMNPSGNPLRGVTLSDNTQTSGLSQIVPIAAGCHYELTAEASIDGSDSNIELIWSGDSCAPIRTDRLDLSDQGYKSIDLFEPIFRLRAAAPELATQVEVRILVPNNSFAFIERVSLVATPQSVLNADLRQVQSKQIIDWQHSPANAFDNRMLVVGVTDQSIELSNESDFLQPSSVAQIFNVESGKAFSFEFKGRASDLIKNAQTVPEVRLQFFADNSATVVSAHVLTINPNNASSHKINGTVPESVTQAQVELVTPKDTGLVISQLSFDQIELREIPINFLAESPGELTVSDLRVGYEMKAVPLPPSPEPGICQATPAALAPGDRCEGGCCKKTEESYCPSCRKSSELTNLQPVLQPNDRPALIGQCRDCGLPLIQNGGQLSTSATLVPVRRIDRTEIQNPINIPLSEVAYIGNVRTRILNENGITRLTQLAQADTGHLVDILDVAEELAESFVVQAKGLVLENREFHLQNLRKTILEKQDIRLKESGIEKGFRNVSKNDTDKRT